MQTAVTAAVRVVTDLQRAFGVNQQRFPEHAVDDEIHVLLHQHLDTATFLAQYSATLGPKLAGNIDSG